MTLGQKLQELVSDSLLEVVCPWAHCSLCIMVMSLSCAQAPGWGWMWRGKGTDMGPALCSGSLSGHRVLMNTRCDGVDVSSEPSGKTQKKRFVSETFLGKHAGTLTVAIRLGHGDE